MLSHRLLRAVLDAREADSSLTVPTGCSTGRVYRVERFWVGPVQASRRAKGPQCAGEALTRLLRSDGPRSK